MNMELLLKLILLVLSMQFMASVGQTNGGKIDDESFISSAEVKYMFEHNTLKEYLRSVNRVEHITGFICACALIREANSIEFKKATAVFPGGTCTDIWIEYIQKATNPACIELRGSDYDPGLLLPQEYFNYSSSLCAAYFVCSKHISCDIKTVRVLNQLRAGTTKTIVEILYKECSRFLLTAENMRYINIFLKAHGESPFPVIKFNRSEKEFAIPKIRNFTDKLICPSFFRKPCIRH